MAIDSVDLEFLLFESLDESTCWGLDCAGLYQAAFVTMDGEQVEIECLGDRRRPRGA